MLGVAAGADGKGVPEDDGSEGEAEEEEGKMEQNGFDDEEQTENERIKQNLKNSSKLYYNLTHSIVEEIKE